MKKRLFSLKLAAILTVCATLTGCSSYRLYGRIERLSPGTSVHEILETPEPTDWVSPTGQRLVVSWVLPRDRYSQDTLALHLDVIFSKGVREVVDVKPISRWGHWIFENPGHKIKERGHISTYKLWITDEEKEIKVFRHKLYREWLDLDSIEDEADL